jgi:uncharacterized protein
VALQYLTRGDLRILLERTSDRASRRRGLLGRTKIDGALLIDRCRMVHTVGMRFPIDVAYGLLSDATSSRAESIEIVDTHTMKTNRFGTPRLRANCVVEAQAGAFDQWHLEVGQRWEVQ